MPDLACDVALAALPTGNLKSEDMEGLLVVLAAAVSGYPDHRIFLDKLFYRDNRRSTTMNDKHTRLRVMLIFMLAGVEKLRTNGEDSLLWTQNSDASLQSGLSNAGVQ